MATEQARWSEHARESPRDVYTGDALEVLDTFPDDQFHAVLTDPTYDIDFNRDKDAWRTIDDYETFMEETARRLRRVAKPGAHAAVMAANTTEHLMKNGFERAGWELRDTLTYHYARSFPKGSHIGRWIDDDEEREEWGDWRGRLKECTDFIALFRAPLDGTSATANQLEHGTGNLNVEAARFGENPDSGGASDGESDNGRLYSDEARSDDTPRGEGRYPTNVALDRYAARLMDDNYGEGASKPPSTFFYGAQPNDEERTCGGLVENDHSTVKPLGLFRWLTRLTTAEGQRVLDPFVGSGTTCVAAELEGRHAVGIDADAEAARTARERVRAVRSGRWSP